MGIPVDILSYAVGLFTDIHAITYFWATLVGIVPFAFIFSYAGMFPWYLQISAFIIGIRIFFRTTHSFTHIK